MKNNILLAAAFASGLIGASAASAQMANQPMSEQHGPMNGQPGTNGHPMADQNMHGNNGAMHQSDMHSSGMQGSDMHDSGTHHSDMRGSTMHHDGNMMTSSARHGSHGMAWSHHAKRCAARYHSYNPRTDRFMLRGGSSRRCML